MYLSVSDALVCERLHIFKLELVDLHNTATFLPPLSSPRFLRYNKR